MPLMYVDPWGLFEVTARTYAEYLGGSLEWKGNYTSNGIIYAMAEFTYDGYSTIITGVLKNNTMCIDNSIMDNYVIDVLSKKMQPMTEAAPSAQFTPINTKVVTVLDPKRKYTNENLFATPDLAAEAFGSTYWFQASTDIGICIDRGDWWTPFALGREYAANIYSITDSSGVPSYYFDNVYASWHDTFIPVIPDLFDAALMTMIAQNNVNYIGIVHIHPCKECCYPYKLSPQDKWFADKFEIGIYSYTKFTKNGSPPLDPYNIKP